MKKLSLDGTSLTREAYRQVVSDGRPVALKEKARGRVAASRAAIERLVAAGASVYGVTTGFGQLSDRRISGDQVRALQVNLVRSTACGVGEPLDESETRGIMLLRANTLARGLSGVRALVIDLLYAMLNRGVHPCRSWPPRWCRRTRYWRWRTRHRPTPSPPTATRKTSSAWAWARR